MKTYLSIHLFGTPQISYRDKPVMGFVSNKTRALLIYLAVTGKPHSREALAELFWADNPSTARINLRKALSNLRKLDGVTLTEPLLDTIAFNRADCWLDVEAFAQIAHEPKPTRDQLTEAAQLYQADFLADFNTSLSCEFEEWALAERACFKRQMIALLRQSMEKHEAVDDQFGAIGDAQRILDLEPWREETHRRLMGLLARSGNRGAALAQYEQCVRALKNELDVPPSEETNILYESIRSGIDANAASPKPRTQTDVEPTKPTTNTNLPIPPTTLVGRHKVLAEIDVMLQRDEVRLLTLTGPGGVGKTRLAVQVGSNHLERFPDGVIFVELAPIQSEILVPVAIAEALGIRESAGNRPWIEHIANHLDDKKILLIIDNFEHVIEGATVVSTLLSRSPNLHVIVTSREALNLRGEIEVPVPPLTLPTSKSSTQQKEIEASEAVQLFIQRAKAVRPAFTTNESEVNQIVEICTRLDGLPLAIELAAARAKILDVTSIAKRIDQRFTFLQHGRRDAPARHQTLQNAIDWSYKQLTEDEQALFRLISVFVGGCTIEAVETIRSKAGGLTTTFELQSSLVDKNLIQRVNIESGEQRFTQLETIREYGLHELDRLGCTNEIVRSHSTYFISLAERARQGFYGPDQKIWMEKLEAEHDNLRVALHRAIANDWAEGALRLGRAMWYFWLQNGYQSVEYYHLRKILTLNDLSKHTSLRAELLLGLGIMVGKTLADQSKHQIAQDCLNQSISLFQQVGNTSGMINALNALGLTYRGMGDFAQAKTCHERSLSYSRKIQDQHGMASALLWLGVLMSIDDNLGAALNNFKEALTAAEEVGDLNLIATIVGKMGSLSLYDKDYQLARHYLEKSTALYRELNNRREISYFLCLLGMTYCYLEHYANAHCCLSEGLTIDRETNFHWGISYMLSGFALFAACQHNLNLALRIMNIASTARANIGGLLLVEERKLFDYIQKLAQQSLSKAEIEKAKNDSQDITVDESIDLIEDTYRSFEYAG